MSSGFWDAALLLIYALLACGLMWYLCWRDGKKDKKGAK